MILDVVFNLGGGTRIKVYDLPVKLGRHTVKFTSEDMYELLSVADVFQAVTFHSYRFQRQTLFVHSYNPETFEFTCRVLHKDGGRGKDPSISADYAVWAAVEEEEEVYDLDGATREELLYLAEDRGIQIPNTYIRKADLIQLLQEEDNA